jgi:phosphoribosylformimino-5-aminoimidazole carboxamide ribotide isomerase
MNRRSANKVSSDFVLFPAIDILGGQCVRLHQGDYDAKTAYGDNPLDVAARWCEAGASFLHIVDLDGAKTGQSVNREMIQGIVRYASSRGVDVEIGGGIRTPETVEMWLEAGATRVVIGTASRDVKTMASWVKQFGTERLVAGLDGRHGKLAVEGWVAQTDVSLVELAEQLASVGVSYALVTDVERDGTLQGANLELALQIQASGLKVIASGGIRDEGDVLEAQRLGLYGAVVGKSLYDGRLSLGGILKRLREEESRC